MGKHKKKKIAWKKNGEDDKIEFGRKKKKNLSLMKKEIAPKKTFEKVKKTYF